MWNLMGWNFAMGDKMCIEANFFRDPVYPNEIEVFTFKGTFPNLLRTTSEIEFKEGMLRIV